ncbi:hypothetical protein CHS0354_001652 [Potamilus streckersoni]|uniref:Uncharacterized protein n=1 Tax=Potamilus streckersoni TaxID=2493646 RepID=A0AAE0SNC0_9BIVA|nr:hypothetical protein CHS0354_001652 [Potamilus streckersoni]
MAGKLPSNQGEALVHKMFEIQNLYRELEDKDEEVRKLRIQKDKMAHEHKEDRERMHERDKAAQKLEFELSRTDDKNKILQNELETVKLSLRNEQELRKNFEKKVNELEKDKKELHSKLGSVRVKLGVANANYNVGKFETDQLRTKLQEAQVNVARMEERLESANKEILNLKDPAGSEFSLTAKRQTLSDKKEIKKLMSEIAKLQEMSNKQTQETEQKDEEIRQLNFEISLLKEKLQNTQADIDSLNQELEEEMKEKEAMLERINGLEEERKYYDEKIKGVKTKLGIFRAKGNVNLGVAKSLKEREDELLDKLKKMEKKVKDLNIEVEQLRHKNMPGGTVRSIKNHEYRLQQVNTNDKLPKITRNDRSKDSDRSSKSLPNPSNRSDKLVSSKSVVPAKLVPKPTSK